MSDGGKRNHISYTGSGAIDIDWLPVGGPFTLTDITANLSAAATTSENLIVKSKDTDDVESLEAFEDLSALSSPEDVSKIFRFDKSFESGDTIMINWPNSDSRTWTVRIRYETDPLLA
jgi:hypothetical protein